MPWVGLHLTTSSTSGGHPGLNRSIDGARSFDRINEGLPGTDVHAFGAGATTLYGAAAGVGVFSSTDSGATWTTVSADAGADPGWSQPEVWAGAAGSR